MNVPQTTNPAGPDLFVRAMYMLLFALVLWALCWTVWVGAVVQFVLRLVNARPNAELVRLGAVLGRYVRQIVEFLTFATETVPYPLSPWPSEQ